MPKDGSQNSPRSDLWFNAQHEAADKQPSAQRIALKKPIPASTYFDLSDSKALVGKHVIDFYSWETKSSIAFKAFITEFSTTWAREAEDMPGAADLATGAVIPKVTKRTIRNITLGWKTVAASLAEAKENMMRCSELIKMGYRTVGGDATKVSTAMVFHVRFANLIVNPIFVTHEAPGAFSPAKKSGLRCEVDNITFTPDFEQGSFDTSEGIFPIVINLSLSLRPVDISWSPASKPWRSSKYPFGQAGLKGEHLKTTSPPDKFENNDASAQAIAEIIHKGAGPTQ